MNLTKTRPKASGWYWCVRQIYVEIHRFDMAQYKKGAVFLSPPRESCRGHAEIAYYRAEEGKAFFLSFLSVKPNDKCKNGFATEFHGQDPKDVAYWSSKCIAPPPEWTRYMPMRAEHIKFAKKCRIKQAVIRKWQNKEAQ